MARTGSDRPRVMMISIDGLQPAHYLGGPRSGPLLSRLALHGAFASEMDPVYPSVTFTNHASLATGTPSDRHGIWANTRWDPRRVLHWNGGESQDWVFGSGELRSTPLWEATERRGRKVAVFFWPVSAGARVHWLLPDVFPIGPTRLRHRWDLVREGATPALVKALERSLGFNPPAGHAEMDEVACRAIEIVLAGPEPPDLLMAHLSNLDHELHEHGTNSRQEGEALARIEGLVGRVLLAAEPARTHVLVFGDHGFIDVDRRVNINSLLLDEGWVHLSPERDRITRWQAIAQTCCAMAPVYVRGEDPALSRRVLEALDAHAGAGYQVLGKKDLARLRALPEAFCAVQCKPGYSMGQALEGPLIGPAGRIRGEHGFLPSHPGMKTGFFALGPGIPAGLELGRAAVIDVAPTVAALLGIPFPQAEGVLLDLFSGKRRQRRSA